MRGFGVCDQFGYADAFVTAGRSAVHIGVYDVFWCKSNSLTGMSSLSFVNVCLASVSSTMYLCICICVCMCFFNVFLDAISLSTPHL